MLHDARPSVERKIVGLIAVPAKTTSGFDASIPMAPTVWPSMPSAWSVHVAPPSGLLETPRREPTNRTLDRAGSIAMVDASRPGTPLIGRQVVPPSTLFSGGVA